MSRTKLLLDLVESVRSTADCLESIAKAIADGDNQPKAARSAATPQEPKPEVTHEMIRELAVQLSRNGKREEVKQLIGKYGVKNITAIADAELESFYADLSGMEVG